MTGSWQYRSLDAIEDLERVVDLEIDVWQANPRDAAPSSIMHAHVASGGLVVGAFDGDRLVGLALAFPGWRQKKSILWSHMAGVHRDYQGCGIGFGLKQFQRTWALEQGYKSIVWTFDPLQSGNAHFNLHRLGAVSNTYHINFYGYMTDGINAGLPSDRLEVMWELRSSRVSGLAAGKVFSSPIISSSAVFLLTDGKQGEPITEVSALSLRTDLLAEIPRDLVVLKDFDPALVLKWRLALREVMQAAFSVGYSAVDCVYQDKSCFYVFSLPQSWFLYVVECIDGSLYTGITLDVQRRVMVHNSGRGAAYTASRRPVRLVAAWQCVDRVAAMMAEIAFKKLSRREKMQLVLSHQPYRDALFVEFDS